MGRDNRQATLVRNPNGQIHGATNCTTKRWSTQGQGSICLWNEAVWVHLLCDLLPLGLHLLIRLLALLLAEHALEGESRAISEVGVIRFDADEDAPKDLELDFCVLLAYHSLLLFVHVPILLWERYHAVDAVARYDNLKTRAPDSGDDGLGGLLAFALEVEEGVQICRGAPGPLRHSMLHIDLVTLLIDDLFCLQLFRQGRNPDGCR
mmetsp:Transcript_47979/g.102741  ORF Transcript_47979/g.102741 Transcript_47979/m.102741 type:complete len:207 (-) Transcript_47979:1976-2596(-)